jgi:MoaA/NifB/PqqE/SkfB family radical SAM enzyme
LINSAVLFLTWHCNLNCPYCWERQAQKHGKFTPEPFIDTDKWIEALNRLEIGTLDISGGEPFMQPRFFEMLQGLNAKRIAVTTNISHDLTQFVKTISPQKVFSMTLSYHPTSRMSFDEFFGKALLLKNKGFQITVNYVAYPEQMYMIPMLHGRFTSAGIRFHIDPYAPTEFFPYEFSEQEKAFLAPFVGGDRANFFEKEMDGHRICSGGRTHLNIQPTGDAYRCIHDKVTGLKKVGNIFDADFSPLKEDEACYDWINCSGCDRDKVEITKPRILV